MSDQDKKRNFIIFLRKQNSVMYQLIMRYQIMNKVISTGIEIRKYCV